MTSQLRTGLFGLTAFLLPTFPKMVPLALIFALLFNAISSTPRRVTFHQLRQLDGGWLVLFYLLHVVGMLWTTNSAHGLFDLQVKLTYLLLPLVFWIYPVGATDKRALLYGLIAGLVVASIACLGRATYLYFNVRQWEHHFYSSRLIWHIHRGYFAMYLVFGLVVCGELIRSEVSKKSRKALALFLIMALFVGMIVLSGAKMAVICLLVMILATGIRALMHSRRKLITGIAFSIGMLLISAGILGNQQAKDRFLSVWSIVNQHQAIDKHSVASTQVRLLVWKSATDLIQLAPIIGHGTGDIKDVLRAQNLQNDYTGAVKKDLNPHSQYLQTGISLGIIGMIVLAGGWLLSFIKSIRHRNWLGTAFVIIVVLSMLTESVMEVHAGVLFIALFGVVFGSTRQNSQA